MHVAFKTTYNNGDEGYLVGFAGTCSKENIEQNILDKRVWCSNGDCACRQYYDEGLTGAPPILPCMESALFTNWEYGAGQYHNGKKAGQPKKLKQVGIGDICILTTRFPNELEEERRITGLFKILKIVYDETTVKADKKIRLRLPLEEAKELYFWNYYNTAGGAFWGSGLQRYLSNESIVCILFDLMETLRDSKNRDVIHTLLNENFPQYTNRPKCDAAIVRPPQVRADIINTNRKYGPGGEGEEHKKLKNYIAKHPEQIGFHNIRNAYVEYRFVSGDQVDILFEHEDGTFSVVEIETNNPIPGAHQAIKYRALLCAERGFPLYSPKIRGVLVSWNIEKNLTLFCSKYEIIYYAVRL